MDEIDSEPQAVSPSGTVKLMSSGNIEDSLMVKGLVRPFLVLPLGPALKGSRPKVASSQAKQINYCARLGTCGVVKNAR